MYIRNNSSVFASFKLSQNSKDLQNKNITNSAKHNRNICDVKSQKQHCFGQRPLVWSEPLKKKKLSFHYKLSIDTSGAKFYYVCVSQKTIILNSIFIEPELCVY
jgi:hypothetical protein